MAEAVKLSLEQKIVEIRKGAAYVQKTKAGYGYKFSPEEDILAIVTPLLNKHRVLLFKHIVPKTLVITPNVYQKIESKLDKSGNPVATEKTVAEYICQADLLFIWVNAENPKEKIEVPWGMVAVQNDASFSFGGALTYATRMYWMKQLDMATSEYGQDEYFAKQREAEDRENKELVGGLIEQIDKIYARFADDKAKRDKFAAELKKVVLIDGKPGANWKMIKDPAMAAQALAVTKKVFEIKEEE